MMLPSYCTSFELSLNNGIFLSHRLWMCNDYFIGCNSVMLPKLKLHRGLRPDHVVISV
jgi:hypothetical protein